MGGNSKAVRFIADALNKIEPLRMIIQADGVRFARQEELFFLFCQTDHGELILEIEFLDGFNCLAELPFSAIHNQQVREQRKCKVGFVAGFLFFLLFGNVARKAPFEHLAHGGKVVWLGDGPDVKAAIVLFSRNALLKNHHAANAGSALGVGDIVAFNPVWNFLHAQN